MSRSRAWLALCLSACAGPSVAIDARATDAPLVIASPAPPALAPCPVGWRVLSVDGLDACEPWPASGRRDDCALGDAHLPGSPDCAALSVACPADGWPASLPTDRPIVYVNDDAPAGGDGRSPATAWQRIGTALASSAPNAIVAVATGHYVDDAMVVTDMRELRGACAAGTFVTTASAGEGAVVLAGGGAALRDLTVDMPERMGVVVRASGVTIEGVVVRAPRAVGVAVLHGDATIHDVQIVDVRPSSPAGAVPERGVYVEGASAMIRGASVLRVRGTGVFVGGAGSALDASGLVVALVSPEDDGTLGRGVEVRLGAHASFTASTLEDLVDMGTTASDAASSLTLSDVVIRRVAPERASGQYGRGIDVEAGAIGHVTRTRVDEATEAGVFAYGDGTTLDLADLIVTRTAPRADGARGRALDVDVGASVTLSRAWLAHSTEMAIFARGATLLGSDVAIDDVRSRPSDGLFGAGAWSEQGARVHLERARVTATRLAAIVSIDHGVVELADVQALGVMASACASTCADLAGGHGLASVFGASLTATRFDVGQTPLCGVVVGDRHPDGTPTSMDLSSGRVHDAPVGACVQLDGFDPERLHDHVAYVQVGVPLQATHYPLPMDAL